MHAYHVYTLIHKLYMLFSNPNCHCMFVIVFQSLELSYQLIRLIFGKNFQSLEGCILLTNLQLVLV